MHPLFFWKDWPRPYKTVWFSLSAVFIFSLGYLWFTWFQGTHGVIEWQRLQEQKIIETAVHEFRVGPFQLTVPGESYVIFESFFHSGSTCRWSLAFAVMPYRSRR